MGNPEHGHRSASKGRVSLPATMDAISNAESDQPPEHSEKSTGKQKARSQTPPEQGGSQSSEASSDATTAGFDFNSEDSGWASAEVKDFHPSYPGGDISGLSKSRAKAKNLRCRHPIRIFGSSKSQPSQVVFTPFSNDFKDNPAIIRKPAAAYFTGNNIEKYKDMDVHTGTPFKTDKGNVIMWAEGQTDLQVTKHSQNRLLRLMRRNTDTRAGLSRSGGECHDTEHQAPSQYHRDGRHPSRYDDDPRQATSEQHSGDGDGSRRSDSPLQRRGHERSSERR